MVGTIILSLVLFNFVLVLFTNFKYIYLQGLLFLFLWYLLFSLRPITYGEDSLNYYQNYFLVYNRWNFPTYGRDFLFKILNAFIVQISSSWYLFTFFWGSVICFFILRLSKFLSEKSAGLFLMIISTSPIFFENTTNILRSTIASLILVLVFLTAGRRKIMNIIIGISVHLFNSIIILTGYLLSRFTLPSKKKYFLIIHTASIVISTLKVIGYSISDGNENIFLGLTTFTSYLGLNYVDSQLISSTVFSVSMYLQFILYSAIPTFYVLHLKRGTELPILIRLLVILQLIYVVFYPEITFLLRLIPFVSIVALLYFVSLRNRFVYFYSLILSLLGCIILIKNYL